MIKAYILSSIAMLGLYGTSAAMGWGMAESAHEQLPADVRQSPGGYRSYHFWHSGIHGGK